MGSGGKSGDWIWVILILFVVLTIPLVLIGLGLLIAGKVYDSNRYIPPDSAYYRVPLCPFDDNNTFHIGTVDPLTGRCDNSSSGNDTSWNAYIVGIDKERTYFLGMVRPVRGTEAEFFIQAEQPGGAVILEPQLLNLTAPSRDDPNDKVPIAGRNVSIKVIDPSDPQCAPPKGCNYLTKIELAQSRLARFKTINNNVTVAVQNLELYSPGTSRPEAYIFVESVKPAKSALSKVGIILIAVGVGIMCAPVLGGTGVAFR